MSDLARPIDEQAGQADVELTAAATAAERANRPRYLVILGAALLVGAIIYVLVAFAGLRGAAWDVTEAARNLSVLSDRIGQIDRIEQANAKRAVPPDPNAVATLEALARSAGLSGVKVADQKSDTQFNERGLRRMRYSTGVDRAEPSKIMTWLTTAMSSPSLTGLEITSLSLSPALATPNKEAGWNLDIEFGRWERRP